MSWNEMKTRPMLIFRLSIVLLAASITSQVVAEAPRPSVLIIMADDCTYNDLPLYGGQNAKTPNIDRLALQGLTFNRAYLSEAMCQPCRAALYTEQFPLRNGCAWNHSASRPSATSMPYHLSNLGYRVGIAGKVHMQPAQVFPFKKVGGFDASCVRAPTKSHDLTDVRSFIKGENDEPYCLVIALVEPHVPWVMGDPSQYPTDKIKLPPNIAETPETRRDFGRYLAEITYMDGQVGDILGALDDTGRADSTLVLFTSKQGSQFPGNKWTNWDTGVHTALVARWPGKTPAGNRTDAIVQYTDIVPTLIELAGGEPSSIDFDGSSFARVLTGKSESHRDYAFGLHNNLPEGPPYPIRTVTDGRFRYIRNLTSDEIYIEKHLMGIMGGSAKHNPYWSSRPREAINSDRTYLLVKRYMRRPTEELYDTASDPYEMKNVAADPKHAKTNKDLAAQLEKWMAEQEDPGVRQDTSEALQAARRGKHLYGPRQSK